jgi:hypothetical protein
VIALAVVLAACSRAPETGTAAKAGLRGAPGAHAVRPGPCDDLPAEVGVYLKADAGWSVTRPEDLADGDPQLWSQSHPGACPGFAPVDLDGRPQPSYALALLKRGPDGVLKKLVVLKREDERLRVVQLVEPYRGSFPPVVWRAPPGEAVSWDGAKKVTPAHDALVYEHLEAEAVLFYWSGDRFRSLLTSD